MAAENEGNVPVPAEAVPLNAEAISLKEFLETVAPGNARRVKGALKPWGGSQGRVSLTDIDLDLYCDTPVKCEGVRTFEKITNDEQIWANSNPYAVYVRFRCRNCSVTIKLYSLVVQHHDGVCTISKLAEVPDFGPPTPSKVIKIVGPEKDYYLKGRRCENQGLGIGAFGYYRRVVENQKNRIIEEIIRAAKKVSASPEMLNNLEAAKAETQFTTAIDKIKPAVPQALLISGQNPLTLLHSALSQGLHAESDEECLGLATSIRVVITELAERTTAVLKDSAEVDKALSQLMQWKAKKAQTEAK